MDLLGEHVEHIVAFPGSEGRGLRLERLFPLPDGMN